MDAMQKFGYKPPTRRRSSSNKIGVIVPDISNPFFVSLFKGMESTAVIENYRLLMLNSNDSLEQEQRNIDLLLEIGVEGLLCTPAGATCSKLKDLVQTGFPVVFVDRLIDIDHDKVVGITVDNEEGAYQATKYLLSLGHRQIVHMAGPSDVSTERDRLKGFKKAVEEQKVEVDDDSVIHGEYHFADAYQRTVAILKGHKTFSAIFASNDQMALGAIQALRERGLRVPDDVSVVGYDDIPYSSMIGLTTVSQPSEQLGRCAVTALLARIQSKISPPHRIVLKPSVIIRSTCGVVAHGAGPSVTSEMQQHAKQTAEPGGVRHVY